MDGRGPEGMSASEIADVSRRDQKMVWFTQPTTIISRSGKFVYGSVSRITMLQDFWQRTAHHYLIYISNLCPSHWFGQKFPTSDQTVNMTTSFQFFQAFPSRFDIKTWHHVTPLFPQVIQASLIPYSHVAGRAWILRPTDATTLLCIDSGSRSTATKMYSIMFQIDSRLTYAEQSLHSISSSIKKSTHFLLSTYEPLGCMVLLWSTSWLGILDTMQR